MHNVINVPAISCRLKNCWPWARRWSRWPSTRQMTPFIIRCVKRAWKGNKPVTSRRLSRSFDVFWHDKTSSSWLTAVEKKDHQKKQKKKNKTLRVTEKTISTCSRTLHKLTHSLNSHVWKHAQAADLVTIFVSTAQRPKNCTWSRCFRPWVPYVDAHALKFLGFKCFWCSYFMIPNKSSQLGFCWHIHHHSTHSSLFFLRKIQVVDR